MKKISYIVAAALVSLGLNSCSLDAENLTDSTSENFPKTEKDATANARMAFLVRSCQILTKNNSHFLDL